MTSSEVRFGRWRRLVPVLILGIATLLVAPVHSLPVLTGSADNVEGDGSGGEVVVGDGTGGVRTLTSSMAGRCQRFILPIYPSSTENWDRAVASAMPRGSILILNQGGTRAGDDPYGAKGGPGFEADPELQERVRLAQTRGFVVIGYIRTGETGSNDGPRRDRDMTDREIADLKAWYDVDGIFYDEVWADERYVDYYADLVSHGRDVAPGLHVFNSGGRPNDAYATLADVHGTFEGHVDDFRDWSPADWQLDYPAAKWAAAVMAVESISEMTSILWLASHTHLGYIYVTDRYGTSTENPWDSLPSYWADQVDYLRSCQ